MSEMLAVLFEGREKMRVARVARPVCGERDVLLRVAACGICGSDARSYFSGDAFTGMGRIPGHEVAGVVAEAGPRAEVYRTGERLALAADLHCGECYYCRRGLLNMCDNLRVLGKHVTGGMAEYLLLDEDILRHGIVNRVPENLPLLHAALSEPLCSVLASHDELAVEPGETVAVLGCGPMGILHLVLLKARGARVIMLDVAAGRLERAARDFGADFTVDAGGEAAVARVVEICGGVGADAAIAAAPSPAAIQQALAMVRKRGRVGVFGGLPAAQAEAPLDCNRIHYRELRVVGNFSYHPRYHAQALGVLASGAVDCAKLITPYPLEDTRQALDDIRHGRVLKAVVTPEGKGTL